MPVVPVFVSKLMQGSCPHSTAFSAPWPSHEQLLPTPSSVIVLQFNAASPCT